MVNLEPGVGGGVYEAEPERRDLVTGGGSGTGIAAFLNGTCDLAKPPAR